VYALLRTPISLFLKTSELAVTTRVPVQEDADLFSINYLHFGAPKVWYCVPPSQKSKFERMCQSVYPELHKACPAFMRHKDIMLSPALLRTYGVEYQQVTKREGGDAWT
jgi:jumonji domain-containing protein 2